MQLVLAVAAVAAVARPDLTALGGLLRPESLLPMCDVTGELPGSCRSCYWSAGGLGGLAPNSTCGECVRGGGDACDACGATLGTLDESCAKCLSQLPGGASQVWDRFAGCLRRLPLSTECAACAQALPPLSDRCAECADTGLRTGCGACSELLHRFRNASCDACRADALRYLPTRAPSLFTQDFTSVPAMVLCAAATILLVLSAVPGRDVHTSPDSAPVVAGRSEGSYDAVVFSIAAVAGLSYLLEAAVCGGDAARWGKAVWYVQLSVTLPMQLWVLGGLGGCSSGGMLFLGGSAALCVTCWAIGCALTPPVSIGFWVVALVLMTPVVYKLAVRVGHASSTAYPRAAALTIVSLLGYFAVWLVSQGTGLVDSDSEVVAQATLDCLSKTVFALIVVGADKSQSVNLFLE
eukprot:TRINITY_DN31986_c0_g1_i1.p1 TRINITY_DN31986_c0_g1~~TRINITY_DN31986_c0_g1_i1.p1  ORF type:complete len:421 (+),score=96.54 TRINITY_DN31986_c0_g1_i1:41-1264(+)